jgi:hypothetical protein
LDTVVKGLSQAPAALAGTLFTRWEEVAGPAVAAHVRPLRLTAGRLVLGADRPAWAIQVKTLVPTLLERVEAVTGTRLSGIDVRVVPPSGTGSGGQASGSVGRRAEGPGSRLDDRPIG